MLMFGHPGHVSLMLWIANHYRSPPKTNDNTAERFAENNEYINIVF
jgi:hypothetical protein